MKNNLYLVQVADSYGPNKFLPLAVSYLWTYAAQDPEIENQWQVKDVIFEKIPIKQLVSKLDDPKLIALSCYVWTWEYNKALAELIKKYFPNCMIVVGGPQVSKYDLEFFKKYPYFDVAILGEGEQAFYDILKNFSDKNFKDLPNVISKQNPKLSPAFRNRNISSIPSPILSGFYDWIINKYPSKENVKWQVTYETLRGCPYQCSFCDIGETYWNKITKFDLDRIYQEITWMGENKIEYVTVCDSNWGMLARDVDITQHVIETKLKYGYPKFWDVTWAKNNSERIFKIAVMDKNAGTNLFKGITFAMQSFNQETLDATARFNLKDDTIKEFLVKYQQENIPTYSELIWPMPYETVESLQENIQRLIDYKQRDFLMVHPLVITENAPMARPEYIKQNQLKYKKVPLDIFWLKIDDPENYITEYVYAVHETNSVNFEDMIQGHMLSYWIILLYYYGWGHYLIEFLSATEKLSQTEIVVRFINYIKKHQSPLLWGQHQLTESGIRNVFLNGGYWGTQINDIYWEYKSASCIVFHHNREQLASELVKFVESEFNYLNATDLVSLGLACCADWQVSYPVKLTADQKIIEQLFNINSDTVLIDHWDNSITSDQEFVHKAYHYQRKNKYWKCTVRPDQ